MVSGHENLNFDILGMKKHGTFAVLFVDEISVTNSPECCLMCPTFCDLVGVPPNLTGRTSTSSVLGMLVDT